MDLWGAIYVGGLVGCRRGGQKMPEYQLPLSTPPFKGVLHLIDPSEHHLALSWPEVLIPAQPAVLSSVGEVHQP